MPPTSMIVAFARSCPGFRVAAMALALASAALAGAPPSRAQAIEDVYTVEDVAVDATARSAAAARDTALANGQAEALRRLFGRLVPRQQAALLPRPGAAEVADLVRNIEIENERTSPVRYIASLRVSFDPDSVRSLLRQRGVRFSETVTKPVVVLPVLQTEDGPILWQQPTPWRQAWSSLPRRDGLVPLVVPLGDLDDLRAIDVERALRGDARALNAIAQLYDADDVLVVAATPSQDSLIAAAPPAALQISVSRFGALGQEETTVQRHAADPAAPDAIWSAAAEAVADGIQESWKQASLIRFDSEQSLVATAPLSGLGDLVDLRRRIAAVPALRSAELIFLAPDEARFRLNFFGDARQLAVALAQRDLRLEPDGDAWRLRAAARPARPEPAAPQAAPADAAAPEAASPAP